MKYGNIKKSLISLILVVLTSASYQKVLAENTVTPEQVKIARHMAQAYLSAGEQNKQAAIEETKRDRQRLQSALAALDELNEVVKFTIEPISSKLNPTEPTSIGKKNDKNTAKKVNKLERKNKIAGIKQKVKAIRVSIEDELPKPWEFWKENTRDDKRKQKIAGLLIEVENTLDKPEQINQARLMEFKNRLTIKKHTPYRISNPPTIRTLGSDVPRVPLPVRVSGNTGK